MKPYGNVRLSVGNECDGTFFLVLSMCEENLNLQAT